MPRIRQIKTNFTSGEISQSLLGRGDLSAYTNGAARLRNVHVYPTGGVTRRPGLRFIGEAAGMGRLIDFEFNIEQTYLMVFTDLLVSIYANGDFVHNLATPWTEEQIKTLVWTQSADTLLLCHQDVEPQKIVRNISGNFEIQAWNFYEKEGLNFQPYYKFAKDDVTLQPSGTSGTITLTASEAFFTSDHINSYVKISAKQVYITAVADDLPHCLGYAFYHGNARMDAGQ